VTAIDPREHVSMLDAAAGSDVDETAASSDELTVSHSVLDSIRAYISLTKPRIIELLLVTTIPTMFLAAGGLPTFGIALATFLGGALAAGGANTLNSYLDRDIDAIMRRTGRRPLVTGRIEPRNALIFGIGLSALSIVVLAVFTNWLAALLGLVAILMYVVGYTMLLKRRTSQNIVWGGAAGCMPVLIAWAAVTGSLTWTPFVLFGIIFFWTPPHYWPLSLRYKDDYEAAGVPMLPVVARPRAVVVQIMRYSWAMVATSLLLIPVGWMGWVYSVAAVVLGGLFLFEAYGLRSRVRQGVDDLKPMRLFHGSITYLSLLFMAVAIDPFIG
jgi:protoheme IX farnesyltransferase